jgi:hypothetical protein
MTTRRPLAGGLSGSDDDIRHQEIFGLLYERHPGSKELLGELDDLLGALWNEALMEGARRQGLLIQGALNGDISVCEDGVQGWVELWPESQPELTHLSEMSE